MSQDVRPGDNVVVIGDFSVASRRRQQNYQRQDECFHEKTTISEGEVIRCNDCEAQVSAYWVLCQILDSVREVRADLNERMESHNEEVAKSVVLRAALAVQSAWRSHRTVPCCPHCGEGISQSDGLGSRVMNREIDKVRKLLRTKNATESRLS